MRKTILKAFFLATIVVLLKGCAGLPEKVAPITDFKLNKYLGTWYEIARLDHRFERGLEQVTANYSLNEDGTVKVTNRGFKAIDGEWKEAFGKAKFSGDSDIGYLKVSFFGPFYGPYVIFEIDSVDYQYAFVTSSKNALWLLSRTPTISPELKAKFITTVRDFGYNVDKLIFVKQKN